MNTNIQDLLGEGDVNGVVAVSPEAASLIRALAAKQDTLVCDCTASTDASTGEPGFCLNGQGVIIVTREGVEDADLVMQLDAALAD